MAPFDVVLVDWYMPEMDGLLIASGVRDLKLAKPPLIIMVTAYGRDDLLETARPVGIRDILAKPVTASSLFNVLLTHLASAGRSLPVPAAAGPDQEALAALAGTRILLVEDNELNQEVAVTLLSDFRVKVDVAENGAVAIEKLAQNDYDLVLMDMQMPVMDGIAATEAIRRQPQFATLPIVAMTANAMQQDRDRCIDAGMNDHIAKPIDPDDLFAKLHKWTLNQGRSAASAAIAPASAAPRPIAEIFADIAGLDVALGLRQVQGREALYLSLLYKFVRGQADARARIAAALLHGDGGGAEIIAHTLKGVAAQIGANQVSELAAQVERAIHQGKPTAELAHLGSAWRRWSVPSSPCCRSRRRSWRRLRSTTKSFEKSVANSSAC